MAGQAGEGRVLIRSIVCAGLLIVNQTKAVIVLGAFFTSLNAQGGRVGYQMQNSLGLLERISGILGRRKNRMGTMEHGVSTYLSSASDEI